MTEEGPGVAPEGFEYEMDLVDGAPTWVLVPVVLQGVAPAASEAGSGASAAATKRGRRGGASAATTPAARQDKQTKQNG